MISTTKLSYFKKSPCRNLKTYFLQPLFSINIPSLVWYIYLYTYIHVVSTVYWSIHKSPVCCSPARAPGAPGEITKGLERIQAREGEFCAHCLPRYTIPRIESQFAMNVYMLGSS